MSDRNKIAQALTVEQLDNFVREIAALPGKEQTYAAIKVRAATLGIEISIESAKSFRTTTFKRHLDRLRKAQELATQVASMQEQGAGNTLADASAALLSQQVFDLIDQLGDEDSLDLKKAGQVAFIISKIRQGDVAVRGFQLKLDEAERKERERNEKKAALQKTITAATEKKGGLTKDTLAEIEAQLSML